MELDREPAVRAHLAFQLEHGARCERFGEGARLDEAAAAYRFIRTELKSKDYDRALLAVLLRAGRFEEAGPVAQDLPDGPERRAAQLAVRAATEGVEPAVREALRIPSGERAAVLDQAAQHLTLARRYPAAARLLDGGAGGGVGRLGGVGGHGQAERDEGGGGAAARAGRQGRGRRRDGRARSGRHGQRVAASKARSALLRS